MSFKSGVKGRGSDRWWERRWWLWWGDMHRMRWARRRVNTMRLMEWRRELIPQVRWCIQWTRFGMVCKIWLLYALYDFHFWGQLLIYWAVLLSVCRPHCEGSAHENCCISNALKDTDILYFLMLLFFSVNCVIMAAQSVAAELCVCEWLN